MQNLPALLSLCVAVCSAYPVDRASEDEDSMELVQVTGGCPLPGVGRAQWENRSLLSIRTTRRMLWAYCVGVGQGQRVTACRMGTGLRIPLCSPLSCRNEQRPEILGVFPRSPAPWLRPRWGVRHTGNRWRGGTKCIFRWDFCRYFNPT